MRVKLRVRVAAGPGHVAIAVAAVREDRAVMCVGLQKGCYLLTYLGRESSAGCAPTRCRGAAAPSSSAHLPVSHLHRRFLKRAIEYQRRQFTACWMQRTPGAGSSDGRGEATDPEDTPRDGGGLLCPSH